MKKNKRTSMEYWLRFLESQGFECHASHGTNYGKWFEKGPFDIKIEKSVTYHPDDLLNGGNSHPIRMFKFCYGNETSNLDFDMTHANDVEFVIKAMSDSISLPLCVNIEWLKNILEEFLTTENVNG